MTYELWDTVSANLIGSYETEQEALAAVREAITLYGPPGGDELLLMRVPPYGAPVLLAEGAELIRRAMERVA